MLASELDDVIDHIEACSQQLWLYEIEKATPEGFPAASSSPG